MQAIKTDKVEPMQAIKTEKVEPIQAIETDKVEPIQAIETEVVVPIQVRQRLPKNDILEVQYTNDWPVHTNQTVPSDQFFPNLEPKTINGASEFPQVIKSGTSKPQNPKEPIHKAKF